MTNDHADTVRSAVATAMSSRRWNPSDLSRAADLDLGTVSDFLSGQRRPKPVTLAKIEAALDMAPGTLADIAAGIDTSGGLTVFEGQRGDTNIVIVAPEGVDEETKQDMIDAAMAVYRAHRRSR